MDERDELNSGDVSRRFAAAERLSLLGPEASFAAVELVSACADEEAIRDFAVAALEELGPPPPDSLASLKSLAANQNELVAYWAITLLGRAGAAAKSGQEALVAVLRDSTQLSLRERSAWALGQIGADSQESIQALQQAASSSESRLSRVAKASLEQMQVSHDGMGR
jgi:hypothetical protein